MFSLVNTQKHHDTGPRIGATMLQITHLILFTDPSLVSSLDANKKAPHSPKHSNRFSLTASPPFSPQSSVKLALQPISFGTSVIHWDYYAYRSCCTSPHTSPDQPASRRSTEQAATHNPDSSNRNSAYVCSPDLCNVRSLRPPNSVGSLREFR
jgi:hypothetical protein